MALSIKEAAKATGLPTKTIRYYDEIGLVTSGRAANGYRVFGKEDFHRLNFVARARSLGFSIEDCRALLALYQDGARSSADVKKLTQESLAKIEKKMRELEAIHKTLSELARKCAGDDRPDCPILESLSK